MKPVFNSFAEPQTDRRKFLLGLLFCSAAGVAALRQPYKHIDYLGRDKLEDIVPKTIGRWKFVGASGLVVPQEGELEKSLYSAMLTRVYSDGQNPPVMLLLAQSGSQDGFLQIHRPEICYTAGGYQVSAPAHHPVEYGSKVVPAIALHASSGASTEHIVYWTRIGNMLPTSWRQQKLAVAEQNLEGIIPDAILVRVSCVSDDAAAAGAIIDSFIRSMLDAVQANRRAVFIA